MHPIPSECPVYGGELVISKLHCRECDTTIEGRFITGPFANLTPEQVKFVEVFIRNEGKLIHMESELNMSYPTIRNRLHEVIRALGYEPGKSDGRMTEEDRRHILEELDKGNITSAEAMEMLRES